MESKLRLSFLAVSIVLFYRCVDCAQIIKLEAEHYSGKNFLYRQAASQDKTVSMRTNDVISLPFCLRKRTSVSVHNVLYTNDGPPNTVQISIDSFTIGEWQSHGRSDMGRLWNEINQSEKVGKPVKLRSGPHRLELRVIPNSWYDPYGIEIDAIFLAIEDSDISSHYVHCLNTRCSDSITYADRHHDRDDIPSGKIVQMSRPSQCLEEDNIKVPIYHERIKQFRISALPPRYRTFWTFKDAQFNGCPEYSEYHWQYMTVFCNNKTRSYRNSKLTCDCDGYDGYDDCSFKVKFDLEGISYGKTDAHIGAILEVGIYQGNDFSVKPKIGVSVNNTIVYKELEQVDLGSSNLVGTWTLPDFTWTEMSFHTSRYLNEIIIDMPQHNVLDFVRLKRRKEKAQNVKKVYQSRHMNVEAVEFDFWWRDFEIENGRESDMEIYVEGVGGEVFKGTAHYIVFIEKRIWAIDGDMDQTFVLYQDGSARILPIVPHGLKSYVPFGNDIVIGQANPLHMRPHAPIKKLVLKPELYIVDVHYQDGGFATLHLFSSMKETNITVSNISFAGNMKYKPFAIFRSTWVEDGRAKVDHVTVNGLPAQHILLDRWTTRYGTNFVFFRKCISVYNTQSPDFSVEILSDSDVSHT